MATTKRKESVRRVVVELGGSTSYCGRQLIRMLSELLSSREARLPIFMVTTHKMPSKLLNLYRNAKIEIIRGGGLRPPQKEKVTITLEYGQLQIIVAAEAGDLRHG